MGLARTGILCWLLARSMKGRLVLRFDDAHLAADDRGILPILRGLDWLGVDWDEGPDIGGAHGPYLESQRLPLYQQCADELITHGRAYVCRCSEARLASLRKQRRGYDGHCRDLNLSPDGRYVVRFRVSNAGQTAVQDLVRGQVQFSNRNLTDPVILRENGVPTYQFAYTVDDHLMGITHAVRDGQVSSTQIMVQLFEALDWQIPHYVHWSTLLAPGGSGKLHSTTCGVGSQTFDVAYIEEYREHGYLPEAVVNLLMLTGYKPERQFFSLPDLVRGFDVSRIRKGDGTLPIHMLDSLNRAHLRGLPAEQLEQIIRKELSKRGIHGNLERLPGLVAAVRDEATTLLDIIDLVEFALTDDVALDLSNLPPTTLPDVARAVLVVFLHEFDSSRQGDAQTAHRAIRSISSRSGVDYFDVIDILRFALTGRRYGLDVWTILSTLDHDDARRRISNAIDYLATD